MHPVLLYFSEDAELEQRFAYHLHANRRSLLNLLASGVFVLDVFVISVRLLGISSSYDITGYMLVGLVFSTLVTWQMGPGLFRPLYKGFPELRWISRLNPQHAEGNHARAVVATESSLSPGQQWAFHILEVQQMLSPFLMIAAYVLVPIKVHDDCNGLNVWANKEYRTHASCIGEVPVETHLVPISEFIFTIIGGFRICRSIVSRLLLAFFIAWELYANMRVGAGVPTLVILHSIYVAYLAWTVEQVERSTFLQTLAKIDALREQRRMALQELQEAEERSATALLNSARAIHNSLRIWKPESSAVISTALLTKVVSIIEETIFATILRGMPHLHRRWRSLAAPMVPLSQGRYLDERDRARSRAGGSGARGAAVPRSGSEMRSLSSFATSTFFRRRRSWVCSTEWSLS